MRVLICGSRSWTDGVAVRHALDSIRTDSAATLGEELTVIEGCAPGADWFAHNYEPAHHRHFPADWEKYGKRAGPIRNQRMFEEAMPDLVIAFSLEPVTKGTAHSMSLAEKYGVRLVHINREGAWDE